MSDTIQKADPILRRRLQLSLLLSVVLGLGAIFALRYWLETQAALAAAGDPDTALRLVRRAYFACAALLSLALVGFGAYLIAQGQSALTTGRFPPPGTRVAVDTPIREGIFALRTGKALHRAGIACLSLALLLLGMSWWLATRAS